MKSLRTITTASIATFFTLALSLSTLFAQNDTMYIMKSGVIVGKYNVNTQIDSIVFYKPIIEDTTSGIFTDSRDGNKYKIVEIGEQVWMAENLAYLPRVHQVADGSEDAAGSYYYVHGYNGTNVAEAKATSNYRTFGVLYNWTAAMDGSASSTSNPSGIRGVCPTGWHLPSDSEWKELEMALGMSLEQADKEGWRGVNEGSKMADSASLWTDYVFGGLDKDAEFGTSGFTALPAGWRQSSDGTYQSLNGWVCWWCATDFDANLAWYRRIRYDSRNVNRNESDKNNGYSVRCVKD